MLARVRRLKVSVIIWCPVCYLTLAMLLPADLQTNVANHFAS
jgi:hypothetical protein